MKTIKFCLLVLCLASISTVVQAQSFNPAKVVRSVAKGFSPRVISVSSSKIVGPVKTNFPISGLREQVSRQVFKSVAGISAQNKFSSLPKMMAWDENCDRNGYDPNGRYLNFPEPPQITGGNAHTAYREYTGNNGWRDFHKVYVKQDPLPFPLKQTRAQEKQSQNQQGNLNEPSSQKEQPEANSDNNGETPSDSSSISADASKDTQPDKAPSGK